MENKNDIKNLNNNEIEKVAGGVESLTREIGHRTKSMSYCRECGKKFDKNFVNAHFLGYCLPICSECTIKRFEKLKQENPYLEPNEIASMLIKSIDGISPEIKNKER